MFSTTIARPDPGTSRSTARPQADPDVLLPPAAASIIGVSYPERFNSLRWSLEEAFDPATGHTIPMPDAINVPYLTTARLAKLTDDEKAAYKAAKGARIEWARAHWMRVVAWGGIRPPCGEYRYSATQCRTWYERIRGLSGDAR